MAVDYATFLSTVEEEARVAHDTAERATQATLTTLGERITAGEARDIAEQLPGPLRPLMIRSRDAEPFGIGEFVHRVASREGVKEPVAKEHARAVFAALGLAVDHKEIEDMRAQLPAAFSELLRAAEHPPGASAAEPRPPSPEPSRVPSADEVYDAVAERTDLDRDGARAAVHATLEALANRISAGQVDDIAAYLPAELQEPLARGKAKSRGAAKPLTLEEFLREIADLEGVTVETARVHAREIFSVLRQIVGTKEYRDVHDQVPDEYAAVMGPRP